MNLSYRTPLTMIFLVSFMLIFSSCNKDTDLFYESILEQEEEVDESDVTDDETSEDPDEETSEDPDDETDVEFKPPRTGGNPDWFPNGPMFSEPNGGSSYRPSSSSEITNPANAGRTAIISNSFDCSGCTFAANQVIVPEGGAINGTDINLNGGYIKEVLNQAFTSSVTFSELYNSSWLSPEIFGGFANDNTDDYLAIEALMKNVVFVKSKSNGVYIKNDTNFIERDGDFIWNFNGGRVEVTSGAKYNTTQTSRDYVFWMGNMNVKFYNGELNCNEVYGRAIWVVGPEAYHFESFNVRNLFSTVDYRAVAIKIAIYTNAPTRDSYGAMGSVNINAPFANGYINDCLIDNINASGDCVFNNSPSGVAKGIWLSYEEINPSVSASIYHSNNIIQNIFGEDAEGVYFDDKTFGGGNRVNEHLISATLFNETVRECNRRALKCTVSNVTLDGCTFEMVTAAMANKAMATLVDFFVFNNTSHPNDHNTNINITDCTFKQPELLPRTDSNCGGSIPDASLLSIADTYDAEVTGNTFDRPDLDNYAGIRLGSSAYPGKIRSSTFSGNTFINCGYDFLQYTLNEGATPIVIDNETFDYDITGTGGASHGVFRFRSSGSATNYAISNLNVDINFSSNINQFYGLIYSAGYEPTDFEWSDINLTYSNARGVYFARYQGNIGNTNTFTNILMTNASGTDSFKIDGPTQNPNLANCKDSDGNQITVQ